MGFGSALRRLFSFPEPESGRTVEELASRLQTNVESLRSIRPSYRRFEIRKRSGGVRRISAPERDLKALQRRISTRLLRRLRCHGAATGFERGKSIVSNALPHAGKALVVRMDLRDFFETTSADRVREYFRAIGWNREASDLLVRLCTTGGSLPQGAPTSPRLCNLVNRRLDARLAGAARRFGAAYTRYADDLTFSFAADDQAALHGLVRAAKRVLADEGYELHLLKKFRVRRRHERQLVTGLVVNERVRLPRRTRRWLRAVEHRSGTGRECTISPSQLAGWKSLASMVRRQGGEPPAARA